MSKHKAWMMRKKKRLRRRRNEKIPSHKSVAGDAVGVGVTEQTWHRFIGSGVENVLVFPYVSMHYITLKISNHFIYFSLRIETATDWQLTYEIFR